MKQQVSKKEKFELNSSLFFGMGLIIALSLLLVAFEWSSPRKSVDMLITPTTVTEVIELVSVKIPEPPKPKMEEPAMVSPEEIVVTDEEVTTPNFVSPEDWAEKPTFIMPALPEPPGGRLTDEEEAVLDFAEIAPVFDGGTSALMQFLASAIRYPQVDIEQGVHGRVMYVRSGKRRKHHRHSCGSRRISDYRQRGKTRYCIHASLETGFSKRQCRKGKVHVAHCFPAK